MNHSKSLVLDGFSVEFFKFFFWGGGLILGKLFYNQLIIVIKMVLLIFLVILITGVLIACLGMVLTHTSFNDKNENNKITLISHNFTFGVLCSYS